MSESTVIFISDGTAITIKAIGDSLLSQFPDVHFKYKIFPYINTIAKAEKILEEIDAIHSTPIIFLSLVDNAIRDIFKHYCVIDLFQAFIPTLSHFLKMPPKPRIHKIHSIDDPQQYSKRIEAIDFALQTDDGLGLKHYGEADLILIGVSRSGKTPTSLYLALNHGILVANYPFTEEDFNQGFPQALANYRHKLFGLSINSQRLSDIRQARRGHSHYAEFTQCQKEVNYMETFYQNYAIPYVDTSVRSIEEIATHIVSQKGLINR